MRFNIYPRLGDIDLSLSEYTVKVIVFSLSCWLIILFVVVGILVIGAVALVVIACLADVYSLGGVCRYCKVCGRRVDTSPSQPIVVSHVTPGPTGQGLQTFQPNSVLLPSPGYPVQEYGFSRPRIYASPLRTEPPPPYTLLVESCPPLVPRRQPKARSVPRTSRRNRHHGRRRHSQ